ncbi:glutathionylspermidine synthase family protein [Nitratifractor sp.]
MVRLRPVEPLDDAYLEELGFTWHTDSDETPYLADVLVEVTPEEAEAYYEAGNELYDMFVAAGEHVVANRLYHELGIPFNLVELIEESWENEIHWHLYGRFDLAGGIDGHPIKLLEFNADTPTALFETAVVQWAILKRNGLDEAAQFNVVYDKLLENFKRLVTLEESVEGFEERYEGWRFLFTSVRGNAEEENTVRLLQYIAQEAGYVTEFAYIDEIEFDGEEGIFYNGENYELWFKLLPWEAIALEEPDLALLLTHIVRNQKAIIFNPAYTLLFQSKGILKVLWDLYPGHPLLLESSFEPLQGKMQVRKPFFGREGGNVAILESDGETVVTDLQGEYGSFPSLYQEYVELPADSEGRRYQAGLFFAYESCGLGYRRGGIILDNLSKFVGHIIA